MKLTKKLLALLAGTALTLTLVSCGDLLGLAKEIAQQYLIDMTEEEKSDSQAAEQAAPQTTAETATQTDAVGGSFAFNIASSGNSLQFYYFDTSATNSFTYTSDGTEYQNCYYQFQFTKKGASNGKWYLYMRSGGQKLKYNDIYSDQWGKDFIAYGSYEGDCFKNNSTDVTAGKLTLYTEKNYKWADINITTQNTDPKASFNVTFTATAGTSGANINSARADAVEK